MSDLRDRVVPDGSRIIYAGKVGAGYDEETLSQRGEKLRSLERDDPLFEKVSIPSYAHWAEPHIVTEIGFTEWTSAGKLQHPLHVGLRDDQAPEDVVREHPR